jgi:hypothetical protein
MKVKVITTRYQTALIEWIGDDGIHRGTVPEEVVNDDIVRDDLLSLAIPYGMDWEFMLDGALGNVTPQVIANNLHRVGIWTLQDLRSRPQDAIGAIQAAYHLDFQTLLRLTEQHLRDNEEVYHG